MRESDDFELLLSIKMGLRKGLEHLRGYRKSMDDRQRNTVSREILKQLRLSNYRIIKGPPAKGHGPNIMPDRKPPQRNRNDTAS